ncbi:beta-ketoacyl-ACP synthase I, partial [Pseudomonadota bacterium]|nr:beta-ketoacyl-ACP synthase I [Pseudomonadota bacterium]
MIKPNRVVVTGMGIVSPIGNNVNEVKDSLINKKSGIVHSPIYEEMGFRSQIHGTVKLNLEDHIDKKQLRFMGAGAAYSVLAMEQ